MARISLIFVALCAFLAAPNSSLAAPLHYRSGDMIKRAASTLEDSGSIVPREVAAALYGVLQRRGAFGLTSTNH